ncbi:acyl-CoA dehydrogenase family protein, partial [Clostridioides difficile]
RVPKSNLLGKEGKGFNIAMTCLDGARIGVGAQAVGIAEGALEAFFFDSMFHKKFICINKTFQNNLLIIILSLWH